MVEIIEIEDTPPRLAPRQQLAPATITTICDSDSDNDDSDDLPEPITLIRQSRAAARQSKLSLQRSPSSNSLVRAKSSSSNGASSASSSRHPSISSRSSARGGVTSKVTSNVLGPLPSNVKEVDRVDKGKGKLIEEDRPASRSVSAESTGKSRNEAASKRRATADSDASSEGEDFWGDRNDGGETSRTSTSSTTGGSKRQKTGTEGQLLASDVWSAKEAALLAKQREKTIKAREAAERRMATDMNVKARSREDRMPELTIEVETSLTTDGGALCTVWPDLLDRLKVDLATVNVLDGKPAQEVATANTSSIFVSSRTPPLLRSVRFRRTVRYTLDTQRRTKVPLADGATRLIVEPTTILLYQPSELLEVVKEGKLLEDIIDARNATGTNHQIFVLVIGLLSHFKKLKAKEDRAYTKAVRQAIETGQQASPTKAKADDGGPSREQVTHELARLRIVQRAFVIECHTHAEAADWIHNIACDVAIRTDSLIDDSHLSFCPDKSARSGKDLEDTYGLMLQQIPQVSVPRSVSIRQKYPTLRSLFEVFARDDGPIDAQAYRTKIAGDAVMRRVGKIFSGRDPLELVNARAARDA